MALKLMTVDLIDEDLAGRVRKQVTEYGILSRSSFPENFSKFDPFKDVKNDEEKKKGSFCYCIQSSVSMIQQMHMRGGGILEWDSMLPISLRPALVDVYLSNLAVCLSDYLLTNEILTCDNRLSDKNHNVFDAEYNYEASLIRGEILSEFAVVQLGSDRLSIKSNQASYMTIMSIMLAFAEYERASDEMIVFLEKSIMDLDNIDKRVHELREVLPYFINQLLIKDGLLMDFLLPNKFNHYCDKVEDTDKKVMISKNKVEDTYHLWRAILFNTLKALFKIRKADERVVVLKLIVNNMVKSISQTNAAGLNTAGSKYALVQSSDEVLSGLRAAI